MEVVACLLLVVFAPVVRCYLQHTPLSNGSPNSSTLQPVIIDTDIGSFIDDSFAIVFAAQSHLLDIKLVVTCTDDTTARAKVTAKLLRMLGRDDIPIGIGIKNGNETHHTLFDWASNEDLSTYKGGVFADGVDKMGEIISSSEQMVNIIAIGPMTNFPTLLQKYPTVVNKARVQAMAGSIYVGYHGNRVPVAEYNVEVCPWCMAVMLQANWSVTITPLDTCGMFTLDSDNLKQMLQVDSPASNALASTLLYFCIANKLPQDNCALTVGTPVVYDVIATLLALPTISHDFLVYSEMPLSVNGSGYTVLDEEHGASTLVALDWKEQAVDKFADTLVHMYNN